MVIGFFLFLVLLLLVFILISYLRKWFRLKKRPQASNDTNGNQTHLQPPSGHKSQHIQMSNMKTSSVQQQQQQQMQQQADGSQLGPPPIIYKKHSRVGLPVIQSSSLATSQPQTPLLMSGKAAKNSNTAHGHVYPSNLVLTPNQTTNIELIHDPNIVMATTPGGTIIGGNGGGINPSSTTTTTIHHHHGHYQEFPPPAQPPPLPPPPPPATSTVVYPAVVSIITDRKDSHPTMIPAVVSSTTNNSGDSSTIRLPGRSSLATITLS